MDPPKVGSATSTLVVAPGAPGVTWAPVRIPTAFLALALLALGASVPGGRTLLVAGQGLDEPFGMAFDAAGNVAVAHPSTGEIYVADSENHRVIRVER